ncbi:hypothetical protein [Roseomonas haemaphysalidis]|uniref:Uncharacterized protein n=1 Tax=Roseomonas haemaphysalidis TaxID=2768162 RepID=A0ABS3KTQ9_9PROT|nr:hypothetical protein [Roseomonas haemaphysalidis]MBO1080863.1 hypothetical protein [Roseomonas haemaphysalidis]
MTQTVKVRIAVAVDKTGDWNAFGSKGSKAHDAMSIAVEMVEDGEARYWITAELPIPSAADVAGEVEAGA